MPDSSINSWESWFIFNLRKNKHQSILRIRFPGCRTCDMLREYMILQNDKHRIITVHTWTAVFLKHLANTSFIALFQAKTEPHSGLTIWSCILLPRPTQYLAVYCNGSSFTPSAFCYLGGFSLMYRYTSQQRYTAYVHTCIYITSALLFFSSLYTSSILLGRLADPDQSRWLHYWMKKRWRTFLPLFRDFETK